MDASAVKNSRRLYIPFFPRNLGRLRGVEFKLVGFDISPTICHDKCDHPLTTYRCKYLIWWSGYQWMMPLSIATTESSECWSSSCAPRWTCPIDSTCATKESWRQTASLSIISRQCVPSTQHWHHLYCAELVMSSVLIFYAKASNLWFAVQDPS